MVPQLGFMIFTSAPTVFRQVAFGRVVIGDGVGILAQHVPNPAPSFPGDDGLHMLLLGPC